MLSYSPFPLRQELERRLALQEQDFTIVKTVKSEAAKVPDLEKELKRLREANSFLRSYIFVIPGGFTHNYILFEQPVQTNNYVVIGRCLHGTYFIQAINNRCQCCRAWCNV